MKGKETPVKVGDKFGTLTVVELLESKRTPGGSYKRMVICQCNCGTTTTKQLNNLSSGNTKSCGKVSCSTRRQTLVERYGYAEPGSQAKNTIFLNYQSNARCRNRDWELSFEDFSNITEKDCYYCGSPPSNSTKDKNGEGRFIYNGIDRVDSSKGYTLDNIVPACIICNRAKTDIAQKDFIDWALRIAKLHRDKT